VSFFQTLGNKSIDRDPSCRSARRYRPPHDLAEISKAGGKAISERELRQADMELFYTIAPCHRLLDTGARRRQRARGVWPPPP